MVRYSELRTVKKGEKRSDNRDKTGRGMDIKQEKRKEKRKN
jgi:hypothetical protein